MDNNAPRPADILMDETKELPMPGDVVDVPDIPLPEEPEDGAIQDEHDGALKYCFVGLGHAGGRIVETFFKLGYRRVCAINTAIQDLQVIQIPEECKRIIGAGAKGAGKDPVVGMKAAKENAEDIVDLMEKCFGTDFDRVFLAVGAGGGTGGGACTEVITLAKQLAQKAGVERGKTRVGVIVALPSNSEGQRPSANAYKLMVKLFALAGQGVLSPLVVIDNERIHRLYPRLSIDQFWDKANQSIASIFHLFNIVAGRTSPYLVFDRADLENVLDSGVVTFGAAAIQNPMEDKYNLSSAVRDNLKRNILSGGLDLSKGRVAACVFIGPPETMQQLPQQSLDYGFDTLNRVLARESTVHRGIYVGNRPQLAVYTMIGGLDKPEERMLELASLGALDIIPR